MNACALQFGNCQASALVYAADCSFDTGNLMRSILLLLLGVPLPLVLLVAFCTHHL